MSSGGVGNCNGVSVGGLGNKKGSSSSSSSTSAGPIGVAKAGRLGRFLFVFPLGFGRMRM